jgi:DNA-binding GntR family transcriptional regulator
VEENQMPPATSRKAPKLYARIEEELRQEIAQGIYPLGDSLPGEHALCDRFGVSRFTIRQAIRKLGEEGLIEARPGVGTVVIATRKREAFVQTLNSVEELLQYPVGTSRRQTEIRQIKATPELAALLHCAVGSQWTWLRAMRVLRSTQMPISWLDAYVLPGLADVLESDNPTGAPLLRQIEERHGHHAAQSQVAISAGRISPEQAGPLMAEAGSPALIIVRRYRGQDGETYLLTYSTHPEDRFSLNFEFEKR